MDEKIEMLHELCETISQEIEKSNDKIRKSGGELSAGDIEYLDKLTHTLKSLKTTIAMMEADGGYSAWDGAGYTGGGYRRGYSRNDRGGNSYRGGSYARGRGNGARRDSMGRYSRDEGVVEELRGIMENSSDDSVRREIQKLIGKIEEM